MSADKHDAPPAASRDALETPKTDGVADHADDVVLVHSRSEDGKGLNVIRKQGDSLHAGQVRPVEEGKPLGGDLISLEPREESPALFNVVTHYRQREASPPKPSAQRPTRNERARSGPPQVSSAGYRSGWDSIWGRKKSSKASLN